MNAYQPDQVRRRRPQYVPRNPSAVYGATTCAFVTPVDVESRCCYAGMVPSGKDEEDNEPTDDTPVVHISTSFSQPEQVPPGIKRPRSESIVMAEDAKFVEYVVHFCRWGTTPGARRHRLVGSFWLEAGSSCVALYQAVQIWSGMPADRQRIALFNYHTNIDGEYIPVAESILAPDDMLPRCSGACILVANEATRHLSLAASPVLFSDPTADDISSVALRYFSVCTVVSSSEGLQFASPSFVIAFPAGEHVDPRDVVSVAAGVLSRGSRTLEQYLKHLHLIHIQIQGQNGNVCFTEAPPVFVSALTSSLYERKRARRRGVDIPPVVPASLMGTAADYTSSIPSHGAAIICPPSQLDRVALVLSLRGSTICSLHTGREPIASVTQGIHNTESSCFATTAAASLDGHHTFNSVWISDILPV